MSKKCFVLMPFAESFDGIWKTVILPTVKRHGDDCTRADDVFQTGPIIDDVLQSIRLADYLIADLTGRNPNVFYELGFAHCLDKPVILLAQELSDVPFDVSHQRLIEYEDTVAGADALKKTLRKYLVNTAP